MCSVVEGCVRSHQDDHQLDGSGKHGGRILCRTFTFAFIRYLPIRADERGFGVTLMNPVKSVDSASTHSSSSRQSRAVRS